jgi:hypothetical protein
MRTAYAISIALAACQNTAAIGPLSLTSAKNYATARWKQVEVPPSIGIAATNVGRYAMEKAGEGGSWAAKNPGSAACAAVAVGGLAVVAAPAIATSPMLAVVGFGPSGPVAGCIPSSSPAYRYNDMLTPVLEQVGSPPVSRA